MSMSRIATAVLAAMFFFELSSAVVWAQPGGTPAPTYPTTTPGYYSTPPAPPPTYRPAVPHRRGLLIGFGVGVGDMADESGPIECFDCDYNPLAGGGDFHIGAMLSPRMGLMLEAWAGAKSLDEAGNNTLLQTMAFAAVQLWVTPRFWLKGGVGWSHLSLLYDDGIVADDRSIAEGGAVMGAVGYELMARPRFAIDLQLRLASARYEGEDSSMGESVEIATLGVGFNWYR